MGLRFLCHIAWPVASNPRIHLELVTDLASQQLVNRYTKLTS